MKYLIKCIFAFLATHILCTVAIVAVAHALWPLETYASICATLDYFGWDCAEGAYTALSNGDYWR